VPGKTNHPKNKHSEKQTFRKTNTPGFEQLGAIVLHCREPLPFELPATANNCHRPGFPNDNFQRFILTI
jgi:hypothetical protein